MTGAAALARALRVNFVKFSGRFEIEELTSRPWASATFSGARHRLILRLEGPGAGAAADGFLDGLAERDFELNGHVLADIALARDSREDGDDRVRLTLEALTVESD
jgi:hypothetical protein